MEGGSSRLRGPDLLNGIDADVHGLAAPHGPVRPRRVRLGLPTLVVLALGLATVVTTIAAHRHDRRADDAAQHALAARVSAVLRDRVTATSDRLVDAATALGLEPHVRRRAFQHVATPLLATPGLSSVLFVARRGERFAPVYRVSRASRHLTPGFDLGSEARRRRAIEASIAQGAPQLTAPLRLLVSGRRGVAIYVPVYRPGAPLRTVAERRRAALGVVDGVYVAGGLIGQAVRVLPAGTAFRVTDRGVALGAAGDVAEGALNRTVDIAGRRWTVAIGPASSGQGIALPTAIVGGLLTLLLGLLSLQAARRERYALEFVNARMRERDRAEARLRHLADHDSLTGLLNRRSFERELNRHALRVARDGPHGAAVVVDLDHFKQINDTLGHGAGDELIVNVAERLREQLRPGDVLARLGGDEFAILLPQGTVSEARVAAEAIVATIAGVTVYATGRRERTVTASAGIAPFDASAPSGEEALVNADLAMYDAKEAGRGRVEVYARPEHAQARTQARMSWADRIRDALEEDRFLLYAQPIVALSDGGAHQYELLLRMRGESGELILPMSFLSSAERFDLIGAIDRWVVRRAIRLLAQQRRSGDEVSFEVNISGRSTGDPELLDLIEQELRRHAVDAHHLIFEMTETTAVANIARAQNFAARLAELGCQFALDDFGAGFGSFYYLKHLPFDYLKIDGEFIRNCTSSRTDQLVIGAVVDIARGLGKKTVAEYVGDAETVELLRRHGVDYVQGFHLGRPAPLREWLPTLECPELESNQRPTP